MLLSLIILLFVATSVLADRSKCSRDNKSSLSPSDVCTQELEGVVYVPSTCSYNYLKSINKVLKAQSPMFWSSPAQAKSVFESFEATYGVIANVADAFGTIYSYPGGAPIASTPKARRHSYFRAVALGEGFNANTNAFPTVSASLSDIYSSIYWNPDGQMYIVAIILPSSKAPMFC